MSTVELILAALALAVYLAYLDHAAAARPARRRVDSELSERRQWERRQAKSAGGSSPFCMLAE